MVAYEREPHGIRSASGHTDIRFSRRQATLPAVVSEGIAIENSGGVDLRLNITVNLEIGSKTLNVHVPGVGPIGRLDVGGPASMCIGTRTSYACVIYLTLSLYRIAKH